ncbi:MAG: MBL fold metallo-hydrolase [Candidatus Aminicenantes bacterium]|nr:MBL fold metallo-hydrolase [Candidatus Aminicenantes bacterium]
MPALDRRDFLGWLLRGSALSALSYLGADGAISSPRKSQGKDGSGVLVKILGTAQDGGIPHLGCRCPNCERARKDPREARLVASLAVADLVDRKFFLIDTTPDLRAQLDAALRAFGPEPADLKGTLAGVVLTHAHIGHYTGLMFFGYESVSMKGLPVYCSPRMADFLAANGPWSQLVRLENIVLKTVTAGEPLALTERLSIVPFGVPHREEYSDTLGFAIRGPRKTLLYVPDIRSWEAWDKPVTEEVERMDFAFLDGTFFSPEELPGRDVSAIGHPMIQESLSLLSGLSPAKKAGVFFTHLNHSNLALDPGGEARKEVVQAGFHLAAEGQEFFI